MLSGKSGARFDIVFICNRAVNEISDSVLSGNISAIFECSPDLS